jgi:hypothetical protein
MQKTFNAFRKDVAVGIRMNKLVCWAIVSTLLMNASVLASVYAFADNVAILPGDVVTSKTVVGQGYSVDVTVTVTNLGTNPATFNVIIYATDTTPITYTIHTFVDEYLAAGTFKTLTFSWGTASFAKGAYTISAEAVLTSATDQDLSNNKCDDGVVKVSIAGDINGDYKNDLQDMYAMGRAFGSTLGAGGLFWHTPAKSCCPHSPNCDIISDGKVDLKDYFAAAKNYGKT